jgi:proline iminopeptidase
MTPSWATPTLWRASPAWSSPGVSTSVPPVRGAWELTHAWYNAELVVVPNAGHSAGDIGMYQAIRTATDRFAGVA